MPTLKISKEESHISQFETMSIEGLKEENVSVEEQYDDEAGAFPTKWLLRGNHKHSEGSEATVRSPRKSYIIMLTLAAGIGGFLFGYDTGVISGALLYIRDDFPEVDKSTELQEAIVSTAILGAAVGASIGGQMNDRVGRKFSILTADIVFAVGALAMAAASHPWHLIVGRLLVGLGVGIASMTVPLYIAEASPPALRGALVSVNVLMITTGQFLSYVVNVAFTQVPGTWRWMLGIAALPAVLQVLLMLPLPDSPNWLWKQGREEEAMAAMRLLRTEAEMEAEMAEKKQRRRAEWEEGEEEEGEEDGEGEEGGRGGRAAVELPPPRLWDLVATAPMRRALTAGVGLQIFQQLVGINTVMYYSPSIVELAGFAAHRTALLLSLVVAAMNALGTVAGILLIDRCGRRVLAMGSLAGVVAALALLGAAFHLTAQGSPAVQRGQGLPGAPGLECGATASSGGWDCGGCLRSGCGFCAAHGSQMAAGVCLVHNATSSDMCWEADRAWFSKGCPSNYGWLALIGLAFYIAAFAPGMGPVPWAVNSEIYPLRLRGLAGGFAATANWIANLLVAQTFLTMVKFLGTSTTFWIFGGIAVLALVFVAIVLPETKGLTLQEVEELWEEK